jgi:anti-sigma factor RsiW
MRIRPFAAPIMVVGLLTGVCGSLVTWSADDRVAASGKLADQRAVYVAADIIVEYRDENGKQVKQWQKFRVDDAEVVGKLAAHFPGILSDRGSGPRTADKWKSRFTILFHHQSDDKGQMRVVHVSPDYSTWKWRDNTPYTGDRQVEGIEQLQKLMEGLAAKHKVDLELTDEDRTKLD